MKSKGMSTTSNENIYQSFRTDLEGLRSVLLTGHGNLKKNSFKGNVKGLPLQTNSNIIFFKDNFRI